MHTRQENILADYAKIADQARQNAANKLYEEDFSQAISRHVDALSGQATAITGKDGNSNPVSPVAPTAPAIETFDWAKLSDSNEFPHLWIVAGTGMGKSTFAQWVCDRLGGEILVADPHFQPGNFPKADLIVGCGMHLGDTAILPGKAKRGQTECRVIGEPKEDTSVCEFLVWLWHEMKRRYGLFAQGKADYPVTNVILDEVPAYAQIDGVQFLFKELIAQARKVKIRIIFLTQGTQVRLIGLEGMSDLRENLTKILLKDFALKEVRDRLNQCKPGSRGESHWQAVYDYLKSCDRPALVNEIPACVPTISG
ncbi:MAG: hypothetical protein QW683_08700 [Candidatus Caldarchaeum sp.]